MGNWTFTASAAAIARAGAGANSAITASSATLNYWSSGAEAVINARTDYDWVTNYSTVGANFKGILAEIEECMVAKQIIVADTSGYNSKTEAQTMIVVYDSMIESNIATLKSTNVRAIAGALS